MASPTYFAKPLLLVYINSLMMRRMIEKGLTKHASVGFAGFGIILSNVLQDNKLANICGELAVALLVS